MCEDPSEGGGGGAFFENAEADDVAREGGGTLEEREVDEDAVAVEAERASPGPALRLAWTILAVKGRIN